MSFSTVMRQLFGFLGGFRRRVSRVTDSRACRGQAGEKAAADHLRLKGFRILARNWRHGHDEIDLVCSQGEILVFVEVRSRDAAAAVSGYHSVGRHKKTALRRACQAYLHALGSRNQPTTWRFDVAEVRTSAGRLPEIQIYENVPLFH